MKLATVTAGPYKGRTVNIEAVDTLTGMSRCDLGDDGTALIRSAHLKKWVTVERVGPYSTGPLGSQL